MKLTRHHLPTLAIALLVGLALLAGPIPQPADYHAFADQGTLFGLRHGFDVWSNLGFALVAIWGWLKLSPRRHQAALAAGWPGYRLFLIALFFTAFGSAYYHVAPDNTRLVWDRLPIALACAGLLAGVRGDSLRRDASQATGLLALFALASVVWWMLTEQAGRGDLRPYLLLQLAPLVLLPLWQWLGKAPEAQRWTMAGALLLYVAAKLAELADHQIAALTSPLTGHTLKHLLATAAAAAVIGALGQESDEEPDRHDTGATPGADRRLRKVIGAAQQLVVLLLVASTLVGCASRSYIREDNPIKNFSNLYNRNFVVAAPTFVGNVVCGAPPLLLTTALDGLYRGPRSDTYYRVGHGLYLVPAHVCGAITGTLFIPLSYLCDEAPWKIDFKSYRIGWNCLVQSQDTQIPSPRLTSGA